VNGTTGQYPDGQQAAPYTGPGGPAPRIRPGRIWYLVAAVVVLAAFGWLGLGLSSLNSKVDNFPRVPLPAGGLVSLPHAGGYVVYYEAPGASRGGIRPFNVQVAPMAPGLAVRSLASYGASVTYSFGSRQGRAVLTLDVSGPGRYRVVAASAPQGDLAFGSSIAGSIVSIVLPTIGLAFLGIGGLVAVAVVRGVKTRRSRRAWTG
jgi:hypothetical protein